MYAKALELVERPQASGPAVLALTISIFDDGNNLLEACAPVEVPDAQIPTLQAAVDKALADYLARQARVLPIPQAIVSTAGVA
jgi:hypothetical protein